MGRNGAVRALFIDCRDEVADALTPEIRAIVPDLAIHRGAPAGAELAALIGDCPAILAYSTAIPRAVLDALPGLRLIVFLSTGAASYIDVADAARRGIRVRNVTAYGDRTIAEHAFALMLAAARDLAAMDREIRAGRFVPRPGIELAGRRLGIVGLGGTGRALAALARDFGMTVLGWNRSPPPAGIVDEDFGRDDAALDALLARADVVSLHLALADETRAILDRRRLGLMRRDAILVNTARGALVDEAALAEALAAGRLRHAALDVYDAEPLAPDAALGRAQNATLSAHAAYRTPEAMERLLRRGLEILRDEIARLDDD